MRGFVTDPDAPSGLRLHDTLPEPEPGAGEFLLDVRAYAINPGELNLVRDRPSGFRPGQDVAGVVVEAARDGGGPPAGARVAAIIDWAGWAERVAVPARWAAVLDERVSFEQGAALPIAGLVALRGVRQGGSLLGRRVLVTGATGGVGQFAVQLARLSGATVTALVSGPDRVEQARSLGAHAVVTDLDDPALGPFDLVFEGIGGQVLTDAVHRLAPHGTVLLYGGVAGPSTLHLRDFYTQALNGRVIGFFGTEVEPHGRGEDLGVLVDLVAEGRLDPRIAHVDDWTRTPEAFARLAGRGVGGKIVLTRD